MTFASCSDNYHTYEGLTWGTSYHIVYKSHKTLNDAIDSVFRSIDDELSMFNETSVVSAINSGQRVATTLVFNEIFTLSQKISALSGGVYDPTVAPLTDLWGFGRGVAQIPSDSTINAILTTVGIADCYIDSLGNIHKKHPLTAFDFSSIAKGYGIDCIGKMLDDNMIDNYMIEIGGEILCKGVSPKGQKWRIQIDAPSSEPIHKRLTVVELGPEPCALASSGNYRNYRTDTHGHIYGHTLSPLTGRPVEGFVLAATVKHNNCATADALATACMAATYTDSAIAILHRANASGVLVIAEADTLSVVHAGL